MALAALAQAAAAQAAPPAPAERDSKIAQLREVQALDQRVADIGWRLATGNVELCPSQTGATGLTLHSASQYAPAYRAAARATFALGSAVRACRPWPTDRRPGWRASARVISS